MADRIQIVITAIDQLVAVVKAQTLALSQMQASLNKTAQAAGQANKAIAGTAQAAGQATQALNAAGAAGGRAQQGLAGAAAGANTAAQALAAVTTGAGGATRALVGMGAGIIVLNQLHEITSKFATATVSAGQSILEAGSRFEQARNLLISITGSTAEADAGLNTVRATAKRLGIDVLDAVDSFAKIQAAAKGTALEGFQATQAFNAVAQASTVAGLSAAKTQLVFFALQQIMSKGRVASEELRRQFAESLPGGFQVAARAAGVTTAALDKMLRDGVINPTEFIPKLTAELTKTFNLTEQSINSTVATVNRFNNSWNELKNAIFTGGVGQAFKDATNGLAGMVDKMREFISTYPAVVTGITVMAAALAGTGGLVALLAGGGLAFNILRAAAVALLGSAALPVIAAVLAAIGVASVETARGVKQLAQDMDAANKSAAEYAKNLDALEKFAKAQEAAAGAAGASPELKKSAEAARARVEALKGLRRAIDEAAESEFSRDRKPSTKTTPEVDEKIVNLIERLNLEAARVAAETARAVTSGKNAFLKEMAQSSVSNIDAFLGASLDALRSEYAATLNFIRLDFEKDVRDAGGNPQALAAARKVRGAKESRAGVDNRNRVEDLLRDTAKIYEKAAADLEKAIDERDKLEIESLKNRVDFAKAQLQLLQDQNGPLDSQVEKLREIDSLEKQRIAQALTLKRTELENTRSELSALGSDDPDNRVRLTQLQNDITKLKNEISDLEAASINAGRALVGAVEAGSIADAKLPNRIKAHESISTALQRQLDIARAQNADSSVTKTLQEAILDSERKILDVQIAQTEERRRQLALTEDTKNEREAIEANLVALRAARDTVGNFAVEARQLADDTAKDFVDRFLDAITQGKDGFRQFFLGLGKTIVADIFQESIADQLQATFQKQLQEGAQIPKTVGGQLLFSIREAFPGLQGVLGANQRKQLNPQEQAVLDAQKAIGDAGIKLSDGAAPRLITAGDKLIEAAHALQGAAGGRVPGQVVAAGASPQAPMYEVKLTEETIHSFSEAWAEAANEGLTDAQQAVVRTGSSTNNSMLQTPLTASNGLLGGIGETAFGIGAFSAAGPGFDGVLQQVQGVLSVIRGFASAWQAIESLMAAFGAVEGVSAGLAAAEGAGAFTDLAAMGFAHGGMVVPQEAVHKFAQGGRVMGGPVYGMVGEEGGELIARMLPARPDDMSGGGGPIEQTIYIVDQRPKGITGKDAVVLVADNIERNGLVAKAVLNTKRRS